MPKFTLRRWVAMSVAGAALGGFAWSGMSLPAAVEVRAAAEAPAKGQLTLESLEKMLTAIGLKATKTESRFDFQFVATHGEDWTLSMSAVLSNDEKSIWLMAWLDELPKAAQDVPRTSLLRLLSDNDKMGNGQFFAYVASNRRFVLQRVLNNENITSASFREALVELGKTVANTYPHWHTDYWKQGGTAAPSEKDEDDGVVPNSAAASGKGAAPPAAGPAAGVGTGATGTGAATKAGTATRR